MRSDYKKHSAYLTIQVPPSLDEAEAAIGTALTIKLIDAFGGTTIHLPVNKHCDEKHPIAKVIGKDGLKALVNHFIGGRYLYIPRCAAGKRLKRDQDIVLRYNAGESVAKLALEYGMSDRNVWDILKRTDMSQAQSCLF